MSWAAVTTLTTAPASAQSGALGIYESPAETAQASQPKRRHSAGEKSKHAVQSEPAKLPTNGQMQLVISIAKQRVAVFNDGKQIAEAPVSTGQAGHLTPLGVFAVISKARYHASNIYSGAPMPYMHRITWSGIALHEGVLPGYPASHGCIRMPGHFVSKLFAASKLGMRVVITRDPAAPVEFASDRLFVPRKAEDLPMAINTTPDVQRLVEIAAAQAGLMMENADAKPAGVQIAEAKPAEITGSVVEPAAPQAIVKLPGNMSDRVPAAAMPAIAKPIAEMPKRKGAVQVFVSRKEGKMYVRQGFAPLFDAPVKIAEPDKPWGTHIFTAMEIDNGKVRWTALTIPSGYAGKADDHRGRKVSPKEIARQEKRASDLANAPAPAVALERFELPKDAVERIEALLAPGSSLIVSDNALSDETGTDTDFIVATQ